MGKRRHSDDWTLNLLERARASEAREAELMGRLRRDVECECMVALMEIKRSTLRAEERQLLVQFLPQVSDTATADGLRQNLREAEDVRAALRKLEPTASTR